MFLEVKIRERSGDSIIVVEASSKAEAIQNVVARGMQVISVSVSVDRSSTSGGQFPVAQFAQDILALLEAGLTLFDSIDALREKERDKANKAIFERVLVRLREGKRFADVLESESTSFPQLFIATVRAAEGSGSMKDALFRFVEYSTAFDALQKKVVTAGIYPLALLVVGGLVTLFLLGYVVPKFASVYESTGRDIPTLSLILLAIGRVIHANWVIVLAIGSLMAIGIVSAMSSPSIRRKIISQLVALPGIRQIASEFRLSRFYRTLSLLLRAGIPLAKSLAMTEELFAGQERARVVALRRVIEEGKSFSSGLEEHKLGTPVALRLVRVGEQAGELAEMLERAAKFHDNELARRVDWIAKLAEPILMTVMGVLIGTVVVLLYLPIFDLASSLQ